MNHFAVSKSLPVSSHTAGTQMVSVQASEVCDAMTLEGFEPLAERAELIEQENCPPRPLWDRAGRVLMFCGQVIKRFSWPARNQELILTAFQEMGWPERIDDPLPITDGVSQKDRLHDTIKCLNRKRLIKAIRFAGDGTGQGVCWRLSEEAPRKPR